jgi:response regulator RpfG family c-di-GMP phosphodiesterase
VACLLISIVLPAYSTISVLPKFGEQLLTIIENDAARTASFLQKSYFKEDQITNNYYLSNNFIESLSYIKENFHIKKIKLFSTSGEVIYSCDPKEIGQVNKRRYFHNIVTKGGKYSKIVRKNETTLEGVVSSSDVAEIYIPIMNKDKFNGAFEIYYDVTVQKHNLDSLLNRYTLILLIFSIIFILFVIIMLFNASNDMLLKRAASKELQNTNNDLEIQVTEKTSQILATQKTSIKALAILAEYHDANTGEHLARIQQYVVILTVWLKDNSPYSQYINSKKDFVEEISLASLLHDIGKTAISKEILTKPDKLTQNEFEIVQKHTLIAGDVLNKANSTFSKYFNKDSYLALARDIALFHHEKWNGQGYPFKLKEDHIPLSARIVALADVYDALSCRRSYKEPFSHTYIVDLIKNEKGKHFDPYVVDAFLALSDEFRAISSSLFLSDEKQTSIKNHDIHI